MAATSILSKAKKPNEAEAKAISQMFSSTKNEKKQPFDPLADSIVEPDKKKKMAIQKRAGLQILNFSC